MYISRAIDKRKVAQRSTGSHIRGKNSSRYLGNEIKKLLFEIFVDFCLPLITQFEQIPLYLLFEIVPMSSKYQCVIIFVCIYKFSCVAPTKVKTAIGKSRKLQKLDNL